MAKAKDVQEDVEDLEKLLDDPEDSDNESQDQDTDDDQDVDNADEDKQNLAKKVEQINYQLINLQKQLEGRNSVSSDVESDVSQDDDPFTALLDRTKQYKDPILADTVRALQEERKARLAREKELLEARQMDLNRISSIAYETSKRQFLEDNEGFTSKDYEDLVQKTQDRVLKNHPDSSGWDNQTWRRVSNEAFDVVVLEAKLEKLKNQDGELKNTSDRPTKGSQVKKSGSGKGRIPPKTDLEALDEAIKEFVAND